LPALCSTYPTGSAGRLRLLNTIKVIMSTLFISDLHLEDSRPDILGCFQAFITGPAQTADAVYILGDLFEYWIGDDALSLSAREVMSATSRLSASGVPLYFIHGNRDFLIGEDYAALCGMRLLPEKRVVDLYGTPTLILHGDTLCTDDTEYQAFRIQSRNPDWQAGVLALSIEERLAMAQGAREASMEHTKSASMEIMDVNENAVRNEFIEHGVTRMIHGHTHRPAVHRVDPGNGTVAERIVLADWYQRGSYLEVSPQGVKSIKL
jgi:UDP-2,3-diacylglucosamine hydrolase